MKKQILIPALLTVSALAAAVNAEAATFKTPKNYSIIIADGAKTTGYFSETREIELSEGKHQLVVMFKGAFKKGHDKIIASAVNPIVINISHVEKDDSYSFTYRRITDYEDATDYAAKQSITITKNGTPADRDEASYMILKSDKGFQLDRDYIAELKSLDLLYVSESNREIKKNTAEKLSNCRDSFTDCPTEVVASAENITAVAEKSNAEKMAADTAAGKSVSADKVNIQMLEGLKSIYGSADPETRKAFKEWLKNN